MRKLISDMLNLESSSGILLFFMALLALVAANSPFAFFHQSLINYLTFFVNDGLMCIFFLSVTLELKRNYLEGKLSDAQVKLPAFAAVGGMIIPALIFVIFNLNNPLTLPGWSIPVATDIAFALGVLSLFGKRVPISLKLFLLALAIFDDIGAICIIAFFYADNLSPLFLCISAILTMTLYWLNINRNISLRLYLIIGVALWFSLYKSGIHPTIAGVLLGLFIPDGRSKKYSLLHRLETTLQPWVAYGILPVFAFLNAGFPLRNISLHSFTHSLVLGIIAGLFVGKQVGVFGSAWLIIKSKQAKLPEKSTWLQLYSIGLLCGIGFTMSLFLGTLSFQNDNLYLAEVRLGVIIASVLSGITGAIVLMAALPKATRSKR